MLHKCAKKERLNANKTQQHNVIFICTIKDINEIKIFYAVAFG